MRSIGKTKIFLVGYRSTVSRLYFCNFLFVLAKPYNIVGLETPASLRSERREQADKFI